jgi:hypothetical protein
MSGLGPPSAWSPGAVFGLDDDNRSPLLAIGQAKWNETMGTGHVDRLRRIRALLTTQNRFGAETAKLVCYSGAGFSDQLRGLRPLKTATSC